MENVSYGARSAQQGKAAAILSRCRVMTTTLTAIASMTLPADPFQVTRCVIYSPNLNVLGMVVHDQQHYEICPRYVSDR